MDRRKASAQLIDACVFFNRDDALLALDAGADPNFARDDNGSPAWFLLLTHSPSSHPEREIAEVFEAMIDAGMVISRDNFDELVEAIEPRHEQCAQCLVSALSSELVSELFLPGNVHGADDVWWSAALANAQAARIDQATPHRPSLPFKRL